MRIRWSICAAYQIQIKSPVHFEVVGLVALKKKNNNDHLICHLYLQKKAIQTEGGVDPFGILGILQ